MIEKKQAQSFCCENLIPDAINFFLSSHKFEKYCALLRIDNL